MSEKINFSNRNRIELVGLLDLPEGDEACPVVVFAHGWDSGKDSPRSVPLAERLVAAGIGAFRIDLTGHGESGGTREQSTMEQQTDDVLSALYHLERVASVDTSRLGVHGASSGALAAVYAATSHAGVKAVVLRGPRTDGLSSAAGMLEAAVLIVQGDSDPLLADSTVFLSYVRSPKHLSVLESAGHLLDRTPKQMEQANAQTVAWFKKYLLASA